MYRDVLVPLDGSTFSEGALAQALPIARASRATLHLLLVHEPIARYAVEIAPNRMIDRWEDQQRDLEGRYLERRALALRQEGVDAVAEIREGDVAVELARRADRNVDLVVMSTHGRGGMERIWAGSVADDVMRHAHAPVLLVPPGAAPPPAAGPGHVVAATDGSAAASAAVEEATTLARLFDARLTLTRVVPTSRTSDAALVARAREAREFLESLAPDAGIRVARRVVRAPRSATGILDVLAEVAGDVLALGTHRRSRFARAILGSVADEVVRGASVPILVAHAPYREG
jgi:nucleotide-binding universal stress UspA family protein